ncbi:hypothetical protein ABIG06_007151 [Bradyrhizobium sp. USDA 326]
MASAEIFRRARGWWVAQKGAPISGRDRRPPVPPRRHCEEPLRRSNPESLLRWILNCFAALAMTEFAEIEVALPLPAESQSQFRILAACFRPSFASAWLPHKIEGAGKTGCRLGTHGPLCANCAKNNCTAAYRCGQTSGLPCAVVLRLMSRSPRGAMHYCPRRLASDPQDLTHRPRASGPHDFAVREPRPSCARDDCSCDAARVHRRSPRVS